MYKYTDFCLGGKKQKWLAPPLCLTSESVHLSDVNLVAEKVVTKLPTCYEISPPTREINAH